MQIRLAVLTFSLCGVTYGCATPADEPAAKAPAAGTQAPAEPRQQSGTYRTGSRLPSYNSDGSSSTGTQSKDDYADEMRRGVSGTSGR